MKLSKNSGILISAIIATKNRPLQLKQCIDSILKNPFKQFEIIVVDQSKNQDSYNLFQQYYSDRIRYIKTPTKGKSNALNIGINKARGDIIALTDDDCIVSPGWLESIYTTFLNNSTIAGVFGKTLPYKPGANPKKRCPSTFNSKEFRVITKPRLHWKYIGFGNNASFRQAVFSTLGGFKSWLGPESIGSNAEDAEISLRCLIKNKTLIYNPDVLIYHNKWLTNGQMKKQNLSYTCGETACYGYFYFQGYSFAKPIILANVRDNYIRTRRLLKKILLFRWNKQLGNDVRDAFNTIVYRNRGLLVGFIYSLIDPIR